MAGTDGEAARQPLVEPKLVKFLKDRPRLIDKGLRKEFLEQLEMNISQRRQPDTMAENVARDAFKRLEDAGGGVVKERVRNRMEQANETVLNNV